MKAETDDASARVEAEVRQILVETCRGEINAATFAIRDIMRAELTAERQAHEATRLERDEALREAEEVLALCEHPRRPDPIYGAEIEALGERVGYGAMMASAQASWRARLERSGSAGGEHVSGPAFATVQRALAIIRAARNLTDKIERKKT